MAKARWSMAKASALWMQMPFDGHFEGKGKGTLNAKALWWQRQGHFEGKSPSMAKARALWRQRRFVAMAKALRSQKEEHFEGKGPSMAKARALWRQRRFDGNGKGPSKPKGRALWRQTPFDGKGKCKGTLLQSYNAKSALHDCNKKTSSFLTITRVLVRLGRKMLHCQRV
jgi:hypothetical protein